MKTENKLGVHAGKKALVLQVGEKRTETVGLGDADSLYGLPWPWGNQSIEWGAGKIVQCL